MGRSGDALGDVGHEEVLLFGEDVGVFYDGLGYDWEEEVVLLELFVIDAEGEPAFWFAVEEANVFVVQGVKVELFWGDFGVVAEYVDFAGVSDGSGIDEFVEW